MAFIYKIENSVNHKIYIGKTTRSLEERWKEHVSGSKHPSPTSHLYNAMKYWGIDKFNISVLVECSEDDLDETERRMIEEYNTRNPDIGYNMAEGGTGGILWREGEHPSIGKQRFGTDNPFYGKTHTDEVRKHLSESARNMRTVVRGNERKRIKLHELPEYESEGWITTSERDRLIKQEKEIIKAVNRALKQALLEEEKKQKHLDRFNRVCMNNGEVIRYVEEEDVTMYLNSGWNIGGLSRELSEAHKEKISAALKGKPGWNKGLTKETDDRVAKMSESLTGRVGAFTGKTHSEETKKHLSEVLSARQLCEDHSDRVKQALANMSEEAKLERNRKQSEAHKGKTMPEETKEKIRQKMLEKSAAGELNTTKGRPSKNKGRKMTPEQVAKMRERASGKIWIHNYQISKMIYPDKFIEYESQGWVRGRLPFKKNS